MEAWQYRNGDVVEVTPERNGYQEPPAPFEGVVDFNKRPPRKKCEHWVWVLTDRSYFSGGWYAKQCRLIRRPEPELALPIPDKVVLGSE